MNKLKKKNLSTKAMSLATSAVLMTMTTFAAETDFTNVYQPIVELLNSLLGPMLAIVGAVGTLYCVLLGVKFAKAEEPQDREKAKAHLKNAIIGFVLIFVLILALNMMLPIMKKWVNAQTHTKIFTDVK